MKISVKVSAAGRAASIPTSSKHSLRESRDWEKLICPVRDPTVRAQMKFTTTMVEA